MRTVTIKLRKNKGITEVLREMSVGDCVTFSNSKDSVKQIAYRLSKIGYVFTTSVRGQGKGIKVERVE